MARLELTDIPGSGGRRRIIRQEAPLHTIEQENAQNISARGFYQAKYNRSAAYTTLGSHLKAGMAEYARLYAGNDIAEQIEAMDSARLEWMYRNRMILPTEYFVYDESNVTPEGNRRLHGTPKRVTMQTYIDMYNGLETRGRQEANAYRNRYR